WERARVRVLACLRFAPSSPSLLPLGEGRFLSTGLVADAQPAKYSASASPPSVIQLRRVPAFDVLRPDQPPPDERRRPVCNRAALSSQFVSLPLRRRANALHPDR